MRRVTNYPPNVSVAFGGAGPILFEERKKEKKETGIVVHKSIKKPLLYCTVLYSTAVYSILYYI